MEIASSSEESNENQYKQVNENNVSEQFESEF